MKKAALCPEAGLSLSLSGGGQTVDTGHDPCYFYPAHRVTYPHRKHVLQLTNVPILSDVVLMLCGCDVMENAVGSVYHGDRSRVKMPGCCLCLSVAARHNEHRSEHNSSKTRKHIMQDNLDNSVNVFNSQWSCETHI